MIDFDTLIANENNIVYKTFIMDAKKHTNPYDNYLSWGKRENGKPNIEYYTYLDSGFIFKYQDILNWNILSRVNEDMDSHILIRTFSDKIKRTIFKNKNITIDEADRVFLERVLAS